MKPEERHELKENSLMIWLQYSLPAFLKKNGSYLLLIAALTWLSYTLWTRHQQSVQETRVKFAQDLVSAEQSNAKNRQIKLQALINDCDVPAIRALALRDLGNYYLATINIGSVEPSPDAPPGSPPPPPVDPADAMARAADAFNRVLKEYPDNILAVGSAKLGLATIAENKRNWDEARKFYQDMTAPGARTGMTFAAIAKSRLESLDKLAKAPELAANVPPPPPPAPPITTTMPAFLEGVNVTAPVSAPTPPATPSE
ncbi:MAG: hypothetical protein FWD53_10470 [Phycisphaerales bacterium]|nr:hypothetical protein [Phycisphaerales bacterium]